MTYTALKNIPNGKFKTAINKLLTDKYGSIPVHILLEHVQGYWQKLEQAKAKKLAKDSKAFSGDGDLERWQQSLVRRWAKKDIVSDAVKGKGKDWFEELIIEAMFGYFGLETLLQCPHVVKFEVSSLGIVYVRWLDGSTTMYESMFPHDPDFMGMLFSSWMHRNGIPPLLGYRTKDEFELPGGAMLTIDTAGRHRTDQTAVVAMPGSHILTFDALLELGSITEPQLKLIRKALAKKLNIVVGGHKYVSEPLGVPLMQSLLAELESDAPAMIFDDENVLGLRKLPLDFLARNKPELSMPEYNDIKKFKTKLENGEVEYFIETNMMGDTLEFLVDTQHNSNASVIASLVGMTGPEVCKRIKSYFPAQLRSSLQYKAISPKQTDLKLTGKELALLIVPAEPGSGKSQIAKMGYVMLNSAVAQSD